MVFPYMGFRPRRSRLERSFFLFFHRSPVRLLTTRLSSVCVVSFVRPPPSLSLSPKLFFFFFPFFLQKEKERWTPIRKKNIEMWRVKNLIQRLESARGNGTSMISLIIRPGDQISRVAKMLADEYGTASNIKSRVNRLSVLGAITSTQQRLKLYSKTPPNGLVIYCGTIITEEGKEKKENVRHGALQAHQHLFVPLRQQISHRSFERIVRIRREIWFHRHGW